MSLKLAQLVLTRTFLSANHIIGRQRNEALPTEATRQKTKKTSKAKRKQNKHSEEPGKADNLHRQNASPS